MRDTVAAAFLLLCLHVAKGMAFAIPLDTIPGAFLHHQFLAVSPACAVVLP
jgi:hypothetical protein